METVWVIESGDYEDRIVMGVADGLDAAVANIKARYGEPYCVEWMPLDGEGERYTLRGHFEHVQGYSTGHVAEYDISAEPLIRSTP